MTKTDDLTADSVSADKGFLEAEDPFLLFDLWMKAAERHETSDPNAMSVASVDENGLPNLRVVFLKDVSFGGFVFYTNFESQKAREFHAAPKAALNFHWKSLSRQVRLRGTIAPVGGSEADEYFASRPRSHQIGAWASQQSSRMETVDALEKAVADYTQKFDGQDVPRPPHWSGFRLMPNEMEFWQGRASRLHDRVVFRRNSNDDNWRKAVLYP